MATLYRTNGTQEKVVPKDGDSFSLSEMQRYVGGCIEIVDARDGRLIIVLNEEGKLNNLPFNHAVTAIYANPNDYIAGDALVVDAGSGEVE